MNAILDTNDVPKEVNESVRSAVTNILEKFTGKVLTKHTRYEILAAVTDYVMATVPPLEAEIDFVESDYYGIMFRVTITRPYGERKVICKNSQTI